MKWQLNAKTGAHHNGHLESIIYALKVGRVRMRWGERLEVRGAEAAPADFIFVPLECILVRSDQEPVVVNLDTEPIEEPEEVRWIDPNHPRS